MSTARRDASGPAEPRDAGGPCAHAEREDGVCTACGHCAHEVILNGACYMCGSADIDPVSVSPKALPPKTLPEDRLIPAGRLMRKPVP